ncbi:hypothetical protein D1224_03680 [Henriciella barbarensis]|uniref:Pentapeptide repeat-containing protein n=1 Tax=Henriciella barbarensis TaxID=86342 RepID=A0A399QWU5_9PROT|nr:hypothetical protein [Henriciella barbarensis]RIJ23380.1 hypothetical protein D1224_03680 [Henriciella barbarensis]
MTFPSLEADCSQCAALCCVLLPFDKSAAFAFDKAGGEPCQHLDACFGCRIHDQLSDRGFKGCVAFDCHGAGQRVVQDVFRGSTWREDPALMSRMSRAFHLMRRVHELLLLLREADGLPLSQAQREEHTALLKMLAPEAVWTEASLETFELSAVETDVRRFLSGLRDIIGA